MLNNQEKQSIWTKSFISISMTQFMVFLIFYALLTTLPVYVINQLGGSASEGGLVVTVMLIAAIIIRPFSANILDKVGKKNGLIISVAIFTVTAFLYIWIQQLIPLLVLRFFHGLSFGLITTATGAIAADVTPSSRRGEGLGYFALAMNVAVVVGPFIALTLLQFVSFQILFIVLSVLMIGGLVSAMVVHVPVMKHSQTVSVNSEKQTWTWRNLFEMKALPVALISSLVSLAYASVLSFITIYADRLGLVTAASYFFLVFAIVMIASRPYFGKTFDKKGPNYVILPCLLIFVIGLVVLSVTGNALVLLLSAALIGLGYGTILPSFQTMAIQAAPEHRSSHATATFFMLYDSGIAIGSYVWGFVATGFGYRSLYVIGGIVVLIAMGAFYLYQSGQSRQRRITGGRQAS